MNQVTEMAERTDERIGAPPESTRRLRVCHVAYTFYEADNRVIRYAREMAARGHVVDVIALRRSDVPLIETIDGVRVIRIQRRSVNESKAGAYLAKLVWFFTKASAVLTALHIKRRYDVVHVHNVPDFLVFSALIPKLTGARIILDIHDIVPELYKGKFGITEQSGTFRALLGVERASCSFADHVIVANDLWRETLLHRSTERCTSILNYPDVSLFKPLDRSQRNHGAPFVFLYPGSLNHHQGVDVAIRAFALAKGEMPDAQFHVYGHGPARPMLEQLVQELQLQERVKIMDRVPIQDMARIIASANVGVVPKRADGFGNEAFSTKILEFMASGVPVIVSRTRVDEHHFNSTLVRFFTPGDERDLAAAMVELYRNTGDAQARAESARTFAHLHSWQRHGGEYRRLVESLVRPTWSGQAAAL
jgi:glycosyltransferase involved in cell wall biosynthesis